MRGPFQEASRPFLGHFRVSDGTLEGNPLTTGRIFALYLNLMSEPGAGQVTAPAKTAIAGGPGDLDFD